MPIVSDENLSKVAILAYCFEVHGGFEAARTFKLQLAPFHSDQEIVGCIRLIGW